MAGSQTQSPFTQTKVPFASTESLFAKCQLPDIFQIICRFSKHWLECPFYKCFNMFYMYFYRFLHTSTYRFQIFLFSFFDYLRATSLLPFSYLVLPSLNEVLTDGQTGGREGGQTDAWTDGQTAWLTDWLTYTYWQVCSSIGVLCWFVRSGLYKHTIHCVPSVHCAANSIQVM